MPLLTRELLGDSTFGWHTHHIGAAAYQSTKSKDPSTKVGCVLIGPDNEPLSSGFNGFARGIGETRGERWERPTKYKFVVHAEANAIYNAARHGVRLNGATAYLNYQPCPCESCANALIQSGIARVVGPNIPFPGVGDGVDYDTHLGIQLLREAGIPILTISTE